MRGPQIYGRKFYPKEGAPDLNFIHTEGPQILKNMISFLSGPKYGRKVHPK
jgi:hypothetical protein